MASTQGTVILARVSSKSQEDEGYSLDSQQKLLQGYCEQRSLKVMRVFKITETASKEQSRKVFHELLRYLNKEGVYHLAVEKTDRLTRNFKDAVAIDEWLDKDPARRLHAVKESLIVHKEAKSDVKFMWNIHVSVAKKYTDNLREEAMKGWAEKLAQGWLPAPPPPGYMTAAVSGKKIHVPNPETKPIIQKMFRLYLQPNQSSLTITEEMRLIGLRTKLGRPYSKSYVYKMLTNPFYIGINRHNGKEYPGAQEQIISKATFDQVQTKLFRKIRAGRYRKHNPMLKGIVMCGICNKHVTWQLQKGRYYGACQRKLEGCKGNKLLREDRIEELVVDMLKSLVSPKPEIIEWVAAAMKESHKSDADTNKKLAASIELQLNRLHTMNNNLYDDKLAGEISTDKYKQKKAQLSSQISDLEERMSTLDQDSAKQLEQRLVLLQLSQKASEIFAERTVDQKRIIISKLFETITYKGGSLSVTYTEFADVIAENVLQTKKILGDVK